MGLVKKGGTWSSLVYGTRFEHEHFKIKSSVRIRQCPFKELSVID